MATSRKAPSVDDFMAALEHPLKETIQAIRAAVLAADPRIAEGIKWNAPSYCTGDYFATTSLREKQGVAVILHRGAKVRPEVPGGMQVDDPGHLLVWLSHDRAKVSFVDAQDFAARRSAFQAIIRQWLPYLDNR